jgi:hypothetical protein
LWKTFSKRVKNKESTRKICPIWMVSFWFNMSVLHA